MTKPFWTYSRLYPNASRGSAMHRSDRPSYPGCAVQIAKHCGANPSPEGRGWPAPVGRVRVHRYFFTSFSFCTPHPPLRGTLSLRERDSQNDTSDSENRLIPTFQLASTDPMLAIWTAQPG